MQQGISQRAVARGTASQIDDVGPPRHQLDRKPVAVAIAPDPAGSRVADRNPPARGRIPGEVLAGRLGYRLRRALIRLRNRRIDYHRLVHIRDVDRHAGVCRLIPVARPDGQLEAGGTGLVVLAPARVEQLAAGRVDLEQPPRRVAALDAVGHRTAVRVRRRDRAQRYPVRAAVRVLRQIEGVARLPKCRCFRCIRDVDRHRRIARLIPVAGPDGQLVRRRTGLVVLAPARVEQLAAGRVDLEQPRRVAALDAVGHRTAVRVRRRDRAQRYPVRAAVRVLRQLEGVELGAEGRRLLLNLLLAVRRILGNRVLPLDRRRGVRDLHLIGPLPGIGSRRDVVGAALGRRERHPAVVALAPVVVQRAGNPVAIGIVDTVQQGISQSAVVRGTASQIDDVGPPRHQLDRKPVAVAIAPDPAGSRVADRNPPARG